MSQRCYVAHIREKDGERQSLEDHLKGVAALARGYAEKLKLGDFGELIGLLHDIGKYGYLFQKYILSSENLMEQDADIDTENLSISQKGKIDHSTSGAQLLWRKMYSKDSAVKKVAAVVLALSLASHHSGLRDCITPDGKDLLSKRMSKDDAETHLSEAVSKLSPEISKRIDELINSDSSMTKISSVIESIKEREMRLEKSGMRDRVCFKLGILLRLIYSMLIDADRTDTIDFENIYSNKIRQHGQYIDWSVLAQRLENHIAKFNPDSTVNIGRKKISDMCMRAAQREKGIFTLTVPTGGGKTLASLRFALNHAMKYQKTNQKIDRIFYIIPYTSIIDQNADVARKILELPGEKDQVILECHSNLTEEKESWKGKLLSENWDAPIVFTTSVQFLETLFGGGTRSVRRMHQFINSIIIFDEIQTLPIKTVHMFCNAINFLIEECGSSVVLCTATQPLLNGVSTKLGSLMYDADNEIMADAVKLFSDFKRVDVIDQRRIGGYSSLDIANMAIEEQSRAGSSLIITNTTKMAREVYINIKSIFTGEVVHLSANMCQAHRKVILYKIREALEASPQKPIICVSTQVIEAGVDVDFGSVIRCLAGLDSMAQAAGRCNRHGLRKTGRVLIINPNNEKISTLKDIEEGQKMALRVLDEARDGIVSLGEDLLAPQTINRYFYYYFYRRADEMLYRVKEPREDTLLNMLSQNGKAVHSYSQINGNMFPETTPFCQSFGTAADLFRSIDAPTRGIIVPYGEAKDIIAELCGEFDPHKFAKLLHKAQRFSVNVYPNVFDNLYRLGAIYEIGGHLKNDKLGVYALKEEFYSSEFGLSTETVSKFKPEVG